MLQCHFDMQMHKAVEMNSVSIISRNLMLCYYIIYVIFTLGMANDNFLMQNFMLSIYLNRSSLYFGQKLQVQSIVCYT